MLSISKTALKIVIFVLILQVSAIAFGWYESFWWFDNLMHFLGGFFIALVVPLVFFRLRGSWPSASVILVVVFIVGVGWEVVEHAWQAIINTVMLVTPLDSGYDMVADMIGGILGAIFVQRRKKRYNTTNAN